MYVYMYIYYVYTKYISCIYIYIPNSVFSEGAVPQNFHLVDFPLTVDVFPCKVQSSTTRRRIELNSNVSRKCHRYLLMYHKHDKNRGCDTSIQSKMKVKQ